MGSEGAAFYAPVPLEDDSATIHSITMHYIDNGAEAVCVYLHRSRMKAGSDKIMARNCSRDAVGVHRNRTVTNITPDSVGVDDSLYIRVFIPAGCEYIFGVATIVYTSGL